MLGVAWQPQIVKKRCRRIYTALNQNAVRFGEPTITQNAVRFDAVMNGIYTSYPLKCFVTPIRQCFLSLLSYDPKCV